MQNTTHWKNEVSDLRARATDVVSGAEARMSARTAARCLSGVIAHVVRSSTLDTMQRACAELVRCEASWSTGFRVLPPPVRGDVDQAVNLIAVVARGMLELAGVDGLRAALSFWATEDDPGVWQQVTGMAA